MAIKKFKKLEKKESSKSIQMLRSNRKGEFNSKEFAILSEDIGIK